ncbi:hypothetical protein EAG_03620 [Camponotus floridanus]|uniref:Uncharacterized protein n=1 Tax=Camponotus floridanus TaxID=104421 RepID=E2AP18_CAMFO|nr:hypothetical protein EAG_03620 [Camponotus floridanus]
MDFHCSPTSPGRYALSKGAKVSASRNPGSRRTWIWGDETVWQAAGLREDFSKLTFGKIEERLEETLIERTIEECKLNERPQNVKGFDLDGNTFISLPFLLYSTTTYVCASPKQEKRRSDTARPREHLMDSDEIILAEYQMSGKDCRIIQTRSVQQAQRHSMIRQRPMLERVQCNCKSSKPNGIQKHGYYSQMNEYVQRDVSYIIRLCVCFRMNIMLAFVKRGVESEALEYFLSSILQTLIWVSTGSDTEGHDKIKGWRELRNVSYKVLENRERHYVATKCKVDRRKAGEAAVHGAYPAPVVSNSGNPVIFRTFKYTTSSSVKNRYLVIWLSGPLSVLAALLASLMALHSRIRVEKRLNSTSIPSSISINRCAIANLD